MTMVFSKKLERAFRRQSSRMGAGPLASAHREGANWWQCEIRRWWRTACGRRLPLLALAARAFTVIETRAFSRCTGSAAGRSSLRMTWSAQSRRRGSWPLTHRHLTAIDNAEKGKGAMMWPFKRKSKRLLVQANWDLAAVSDHAPGAQGPTVTSGKGRECPSCGHFKFRPDGAIYRCSNRMCQAVGFYDRPGGPGRGPGKTCPNCNEMCLHRVGTEPKVLWCTNCNLTTVAKEHKTLRADIWQALPGRPRHACAPAKTELEWQGIYWAMSLSENKAAAAIAGGNGISHVRTTVMPASFAKCWTPWSSE